MPLDNGVTLPGPGITIVLKHFFLCVCAKKWPSFVITKLFKMPK